ncbi:sigma-70 family RNA polymerase sigma factor [Verrucomicrobiaceae bacterium 227]
MEEGARHPGDPQWLGNEFEKIRSELRAYVTAILGSPDGADDVLQEAALVVLEKRDEVSNLRNFKSWCLRIAYFKALAYRRDHSRQGELNLRMEVLERVASRAEEVAFEISERREALRKCLGKMRPSDVELLQLKYVDGVNLTKISKAWGKSANQIHKMISRVRTKLRNCIDQNL